MRPLRGHDLFRITVGACLALAAACAVSHSEQREAPAPEIAPVPVSVPVAEASLAPAVEPERLLARAPAPEPPVDPVDRMLAAAREGLGKRGGRGGIDCSTFVRAAYSAGGIDLYSEALARDNGVQAIHRYVRRHGRLYRRRLPAKGDLVFFDNSYDRNRNHVLDDRLTHLGIVEEVRADGTALVLHSTNHGVVREPMNLRRPHATANAAGQPINAMLRRRTSHDSPRTPHLMSELFAGFGTVFGVEHRPVEPAARRPAHRR